MAEGPEPIETETSLELLEAGSIPQMYDKISLACLNHQSKYELGLLLNTEIVSGKRVLRRKQKECTRE